MIDPRRFAHGAVSEEMDSQRPSVKRTTETVEPIWVAIAQEVHDPAARANQARVVPQSNALL